MGAIRQAVRGKTPDATGVHRRYTDCVVPSKTFTVLLAIAVPIEGQGGVIGNAVAHRATVT